MSGAWVLKNGMITRLAEGSNQQSSVNSRSKTNQASINTVLVHLPTGEVVSSYSSLTQMLVDLGWETYDDGDAQLLQFSRASDLISLPKDFDQFKEDHMYKIIVNNPNVFQVVN